MPEGDAPEDAPALETETPEGTSEPEIETSEDSKFITALCDTAKRKKRVIARVHGDFENPRFSIPEKLTMPEITVQTRKGVTVSYEPQAQATA